MRLQLALNVDDIDEAVSFYSKLFGVEPAKRKPGYANFAIAQPPLKLVLFELKGAKERLNHLGVEVFEASDVTVATERLKQAGLADLVEDEATCCYAKQDKVWALEPQGLRWEWYRVLEDTEHFGRDVGLSESVGTPLGGSPTDADVGNPPNPTPERCC
jgi:catechol 2,3-dioxygenase-like lactoylglutathione lyase family enzyme